MRVLVTGATGLLGNNVVRKLLESGYQVRVLVRESSSSRPLEGLSVEKSSGDVRDAARVQAAMNGVQLVIHSAAVVEMGRRREALLRSVNVDGTRTVAAAARAAGASMVHISSADAVGVGTLKDPADEDTPDYPDTHLPYVATKRDAEQVVRQEIDRGLHGVIINPSYMVGPWDWKPSSGRLMLEVARGHVILAPRGYFSVCDVRDVADGVIAAAQRGTCGRRYIMAGTNCSYLEAASLFAEVTGGRTPHGRLGPALTKIVGWSGDLWGAVSQRDPEFNSSVLDWARQPKYYSCARAQNELGFRHRPLRETVDAAWNWFQEYGYV